MSECLEEVTCCCDLCDLSDKMSDKTKHFYNYTSEDNLKQREPCPDYMLLQSALKLHFRSLHRFIQRLSK